MFECHHKRLWLGYLNPLLSNPFFHTVDNEELSSLRLRLEQTERQMMRLLHAMDAAEHIVAQSEPNEVDEPDTFAYDADLLGTTQPRCHEIGQVLPDASQECDHSVDDNDCCEVEDVPSSDYESGKLRQSAHFYSCF